MAFYFSEISVSDIYKESKELKVWKASYFTNYLKAFIITK